MVNEHILSQIVNEQEKEVFKGMRTDMNNAKAVMVKEGKTYYPDKQKHEKYFEIYKCYEKIYNAVRPIIIGE